MNKINPNGSGRFETRATGGALNAEDGGIVTENPSTNTASTTCRGIKTDLQAVEFRVQIKPDKKKILSDKVYYSWWKPRRATGDFTLRRNRTVPGDNPPSTRWPCDPVWQCPPCKRRGRLRTRTTASGSTRPWNKSSAPRTPLHRVGEKSMTASPRRRLFACVLVCMAFVLPCLRGEEASDAKLPPIGDAVRDSDGEILPGQTPGSARARTAETRSCRARIPTAGSFFIREGSTPDISRCAICLFTIHAAT